VRRWLGGAAQALALLLVARVVAGERPAAPTGRWLREAGLEARYCRGDGLRLRYVRAGQGPPLLLLHGLASSLFTWSDVLPELARSHDVVALDLPGFGLSDQPADLSFARLVRATLGAMDELGLERASLAGNSLGGAVAIAIAAEHPERVEKLVLLDSAGFNVDPEQRPAILRLVRALPASLLELLPVRRPFTRAALQRVFFDPAKVSEERVEEYVAPLLRPGSVRAIRSVLKPRAAEVAAFPELVARVRAPTLILWGNEDRWVPVEQAELFRAAIPGSRTIVLRRCGHVPQEERPIETGALVESFLSK
jgi:pimeloyl-ACP methyl ester carboxylesterase